MEWNSIIGNRPRQKIWRVSGFWQKVYTSLFLNQDLFKGKCGTAFCHWIGTAMDCLYILVFVFLDGWILLKMRHFMPAQKADLCSYWSFCRGLAYTKRFQFRVLVRMSNILIYNWTCHSTWRFWTRIHRSIQKNHIYWVLLIIRGGNFGQRKSHSSQEIHKIVKMTRAKFNTTAMVHGTLPTTEAFLVI